MREKWVALFFEMRENHFAACVSAEFRIAMCDSCAIKFNHVGFSEAVSESRHPLGLLPTNEGTHSNRNNNTIAQLKPAVLVGTSINSILHNGANNREELGEERWQCKSG